MNLQQGAYGKVQIAIHEPMAYEDGPKVLNDVKAKKIVLLNFEMLETEKKKQVFELTAEEYDQILSAAAAEALQSDRRNIFGGSARNGFLAERLTELADRAVKTVQKQMQRGELSFYQEEIHFRPEDWAALRFFTEDGAEFFL